MIIKVVLSLCGQRVGRIFRSTRQHYRAVWCRGNMEWSGKDWMTGTLRRPAAAAGCCSGCYYLASSFTFFIRTRASSGGQDHLTSSPTGLFTASVPTRNVTDTCLVFTKAAITLFRYF